MVTIDLQDMSIRGSGKRDTEHTGFTTAPALLFQDVELAEVDTYLPDGVFTITNQKNTFDNLLTFFIKVVDGYGDEVDDDTVANVACGVNIKPNGIDDEFFKTDFDLEHAKSMHQLRRFPEGSYRFVVLNTQGNDDHLMTVWVSVSE